MPRHHALRLTLSHRPWLGWLLLLVLMLGAGCGQEADTGPADPNRLIWRQLTGVITEQDLSRIALLRVEDKVSQRENIERQVHQQLLAELTLIPDLRLVETNQAIVEDLRVRHGATLSQAIPAPMTLELCQQLDVEAFVFATVENNDYDVNLKLYLGRTGTVIFTKTLEDLQLPAGNQPVLDLGAPGGGAEIQTEVQTAP